MTDFNDKKARVALLETNQLEYLTGLQKHFGLDHRIANDEDAEVLMRMSAQFSDDKATLAAQNKVSLREALAAESHKIWASWMEYLFKVCPINENGEAVISAYSVERWHRQIATPYSELSEKEKDSDREQADKILKVISERGNTDV